MQSHPTLDELVNEIAELQPLPTVAAQILSITEDDRFSAHELATLIASDQALTAKMLRLANSAYYSFPRRITTVRDAVVLLGFRAVRSATLVSCVIGAAPGSTNISYGSFWQFSMCVGMLSEVLSRAENAHQDHAFTAGVLHNIGRLALDQHVPETFGQVIEQARAQGVSIHDAERSMLGFTDAEVGGALTLHWNFPPELVDAVANHAQPPSAAIDPTSLVAFTVRARAFARAYGLNDGVELLERTDTPSEWTTPPLSVTLSQAGGMETMLDKVDAFLETALPV